MSDLEAAVPSCSKQRERSENGDDDFDIVEMTPTQRAEISRGDFRIQTLPTLHHPDATPYDQPDDRILSQQSVDPFKPDNSIGPELKIIDHSKKENSIGDPSNRDNSDNFPPTETSVLVTFVANITKAFSAHEYESQSPISIAEQDSSSLGNEQQLTFESKSKRDVRELPLIIGLYDGEDAVMKPQLIFKNSNDPAARDFALFLKEDGISPRIPVLCMSDYGIGEYASDLWTLPHNAIKRELFDLYEIIGVIRMRYLSLTFCDFYNLRVWWRLFGVFLIQYLTTEITLLDPLLKTVVGVDGRGESLRRKITPLFEMREWVLCKFEEISGYMEEFETLPRGRALSLICRTIDALGFKLMTLFNQQERCLPSMVESYHDESIKLSTELKMIEILRASDFFPEAIVHQVRWMEAGKSREKWLTSHLRWSERAHIGQFYKRYEMNHGRIVVAFRGKLRG
jgi:hypothetical protein